MQVLSVSCTEAVIPWDLPVHYWLEQPAHGKWSLTSWPLAGVSHVSAYQWLVGRGIQQPVGSELTYRVAG